LYIVETPRPMDAVAVAVVVVAVEEAVEVEETTVDDTVAAVPVVVPRTSLARAETVN
jgi:hypothetical protein